MKFTTSIFAFVASVALINAQDLSGIPSCAIPCFAAAIPNSGCKVSDTTCQCTTGKNSITASVAQCLPSKCSTDDQAKTLQASEDICAKAGVTVAVSVSTASATGSATAKGSGASASLAGSASTSASASAAAQSTGAAAEMRGNLIGMGAAVLGAAVLGF